MSEIVGDIPAFINGIAVAATAGGYAIGQGLDSLALKNIAHNRQAGISSHEDIATFAVRPSGLRRGIAVLALVGAAAGFAFGEAATATETPPHNPANLTIVADHSYKTGPDGAASRLNKVADSFLGVSTSKIHEETVVAHNSDADPIALKDLASDRPYGQLSSMEPATKLAIGTAYTNSPVVKSNALGSNEHASGVLVLTDNDAIGDVMAEDPHHLPVFVVNFGSNSGPSATSLSAIAKETGGQYIPSQTVSNGKVEVTSTNSIIKIIETDIVPQTGTASAEQSASDRIPLLILGLGLSGIEAYQFVRRKRETVA